MANRLNSPEQLTLKFDAPCLVAPITSNVIPLHRELSRGGAVQPPASRVAEPATVEESTILRRVIAEAERLGW